MFEGQTAAEFVELLRAVLGLPPLPPEPNHAARKTCTKCGRKHRVQTSELCARCAKLPARYKPQPSEIAIHG